MTGGGFGSTLHADIERKMQQVLHSTFGYVQDDEL
jgi:hypothetical protein